jgi:uncharacterized protein YecE (DUF72 family)
MLKLAMKPTADFANVRWMGPDRRIVDNSRVQLDVTKELDAWAAVLPTMAERLSVVYGYINNHFSGHSPATVREMQRRLGQQVTEPSEITEQLTLL